MTPGSVSATFSWAFGDGATFASSGTNHSSVEHTYASSGNFTASVVVSSAMGTGSAEVAILVQSTPLGVTIAASPMNGEAPLTVHFAATPAGGTGTYSSIVWQFGSAGTGSGPDVAFTFPSAGSYNVTVDVTDSGGASTEAAVEIEVRAGTGGPSGNDPAPAADAWLEGAAAALAVVAIGLTSYRLWTARRPLPPPVVPAGAVHTSPLRPARGRPTAPGEALARPSAPADESRRLSERILIHLYWAGRPTGEGVAAVAATQAGMAREFGVTQNAISKAAQRLVETGAVTVALRHVPGAPRRLKTYQLTARGEPLARALASEARPPPTP